MNKIASTIIIVALVVGLGIVFLGGPKSKNPEVASEQQVQNVEVRDGIQYVTISAKGGYSPRTSTAEAGIPTKLIIKTNKTYDCSASLAIHSVGFQKILPQTGETEIDIGIPKVGEPLQGVCGMGMYSFVVDFS